ncbi:MAG: hypothetical protein MASP_01906 [Candidatus Methanolliviera sp. GoM_asphalt]|nr:MAG: hypothetical protein MASP_01906 [Candidatus Methanolliviera sp. GoM_asphalt]
MSEEQEGKEIKGKENAKLSEEEKRYYTSMLEEADEIVFQYEGIMNYEHLDEPSSDLVGEVFNKIATPLFYLRDGKESMPVASKKTDEGDEKRGKEESIGDEIADVMMKVEREKRCEDEEHCGEEEVINEYEEKATINGILGDQVKILDIQEVEEGGFGGSDIEIEGIGKVRTYSKVLGGQLQHLKDTGKLPALGKIEKKHSGKSGRSYFNFFPSSSFIQEREPRAKPIFADKQERTLADEEKEISEFMDY